MWLCPGPRLCVHCGAGCPGVGLGCVCVSGCLVVCVGVRGGWVGEGHAGVCVSVPRSSEKGELVTAPGGTGGS